MGLEKLFEIILDFIGLFQFWVVVDETEQGVVLQLGKYRRTLAKPGIYLCCPFDIDETLVHDITFDTIALQTQTLTMKDERKIVITAVIGFRVSDIKKFCLDVESADSALRDSAYGIIGDSVRHSELSDLMSDDWQIKVFKEIREAGRAFGLECESLRFKDFGIIPTIRLINSDDGDE